MSLQQRLDRIREGFEKQAPAQVLTVMYNATENLRSSGILDRAIGEGDKAPDFSLSDSMGNQVNKAELLASGPVILTFFRGDW
jgi:hypothetical protein